MTHKIVQKHPTRGTREFELVDDGIDYKYASDLGKEELTVVLSVLSPKPVIDGEMMYFLSEVNREALVKMFVDLPDAETHKAFVSALQQRIKDERFGELNAANRRSVVTQEQVDTTIRMLETNIDPTTIEQLLSTLRELSKAPNDQNRLDNVVSEFNSLGMQQGPVLSYTTFFNTLLLNTEME